MNFPSRAERESATTTRYAGFRVVPVRLSLMCTATGHLSCSVVVVCMVRGSARQEGQGALELAHPPLHVLEPLHHLPELGILLEQPVHVGDVGPAPPRDASAAAAVDDRRLAPLVWRHRSDD